MRMVVENRPMQWLLLALWSALIFWAAPGRRSFLRPVLALGLGGAMAAQLLLLQLDGLFTWENALPFHLCSLFGVLSIPMLWHTSPVFHEAICFLGAPGAFLTLFFPAVIRCSHPLLMHAAFDQLHVLVALIPLYFHLTGRPLPTDPRRTLVVGNGYLVLVCLFNRLFGTNYLFLRAAPAGTPLVWMFRRGTAFYLCALELLCILVFSFLKPVYAYFRK